MSTFKIPNEQGQVRQNNRSDTFGELAETFSIDLNRKFGKIFPSKKLVKVLDEVTHLSNSDPVAFSIFDNKYWAITSDDPYYCSLTADPTNSANWAEETSITGSLSGDTDSAVFAGELLMTTGGTNIRSWDGSSYTANWASGKLTTSGAAFKQMHVFRGDSDWLNAANGNKLNMLRDNNGSFSEFIITAQEDLEFTCINSGVSRVWAGTTSTSDSNAYVYEILPGSVTNVTDADGVVLDTVAKPQAAYKVEGTAVMAMEVIDNVPYILTEKGNIQAFNGAGFTTVASFPFANTTEVIKKTAVHPKGMKLHNDSIYINISTERRADTAKDYVENCPSGIWEFNRLTGQLNHRFSFAETDADNGAREMNSGKTAPIMILDNEYALLLAGGEIEGGNSGVFADTGSRYGYFKTVEIGSGTVQAAYERVYAKAKTMASGESVSIKYRIIKKDQVTVDGALADTTTFNTTGDLSSITADADGTYHWDITDIHTGKTAQVTNIVNSGSTYSVTLDAAIGTTGDSIRGEFQNWTKVNGDYTSDDGESKDWGGFGTNPWIQFKVILDGDIEMRQLVAKDNAKHEV